MKRDECADCYALVEGDSKEWICDEAGKKVEDVEKCPSVSNTHTCRYCGSEAEGSDGDLLCSNCRELFGHTFYSEL